MDKNKGDDCGDEYGPGAAGDEHDDDDDDDDDDADDDDAIFPSTCTFVLQRRCTWQKGKTSLLMDLSNGRVFHQSWSSLKDQAEVEGHTEPGWPNIAAVRR